MAAMHPNEPLRNPYALPRRRRRGQPEAQVRAFEKLAEELRLARGVVDAERDQAGGEELTRDLHPPQLERARSARAPAEVVRLPEGSLDAVFASPTHHRYTLRFGTTSLFIGWNPLGQSLRVIQEDAPFHGADALDVSHAYPWRAFVGMNLAQDVVHVRRAPLDVQLRFRAADGSTAGLSIGTRRSRLALLLIEQTFAQPLDAGSGRSRGEG